MIPKAAVAVIIRDNQVLLGLSTDTDFRLGKHCFVAGSQEPGESLVDTAVREAREEANVYVIPRKGEVYKIDSNPEVVYVICDYDKGVPVPNNEFSYIGWYDIDNLPKNTLEVNAQVLSKLFYKV